MLKRETIYQELARRIGRGVWKPGDKLPAEPVLCRELGVARVTLRAALDQLADEGFLSRSRPAGTIVTIPDNAKKKVLVIAEGSSAQPEVSRPELYIIPGIERRCLELNMEMEIVNSVFLPAELPENYLGVILLACDFNGREKILGKVRSLNVPVVNAHTFPRDPQVTGLPSLLTDFRSAFLAGLTHLTQMGHRKIGFVMNEWKTAEKRFDISMREFPGFLKQAGAAFEDRFLIQVSRVDADFSEELRALVFSDDPPTALYAYSDYFAMTCCNLLKQWGVRIPEQIAVMGFSGYTSAALQSPPLSTVDFGYARIGRIAVDMLRQHEKWFGKTVPLVYSPYDVIPRRSTDFFRMDFAENAKRGGRKIQDTSRKTQEKSLNRLESE